MNINNYKIAVELASNYQQIKGFVHIKKKNIEILTKEEKILIDKKIKINLEDEIIEKTLVK